MAILASNVISGVFYAKLIVTSMLLTGVAGLVLGAGLGAFIGYLVYRHRKQEDESAVEN
ncbi:MAG: hypothetical protein HY747_07740 [Elusimicrobia bacterium]|nr:hypothetical protein [Elusimicrobiota bacterium]